MAACSSKRPRSRRISANGQAVFLQLAEAARAAPNHRLNSTISEQLLRASTRPHRPSPSNAQRPAQSGECVATSGTPANVGEVSGRGCAGAEDQHPEPPKKQGGGCSHRPPLCFAFQHLPTKSDDSDGRMSDALAANTRRHSMLHSRA